MKIDPYVLDAIKGMDLPKLLQSYGLVLKPTGKNSYQTKCPFHDDKTPSLSVGFRNNKWIWNCFGCRAHGNYLDFRMAFEKIPFTEAYEKCAVELGRVPVPANGGAHTNGAAVPPAPSPADGPAPTAKREGDVPRQELLRQAVALYHQAFLEDRRGPAYLAGRGIQDPELLRRFQIGFVNGKLAPMLPPDPDHDYVRGLKEVGLLNEKGTERFYNCVVFPIFDENGAVVGLYGRNTRSWTAVKHLYLPGPHQGVWNGQAVKAHKEIILVESILDALSLVALGFPNAVPLYGTHGLTEDHLRLLREHRTRHVFLCLDNDKAGEEARHILKPKIAALGVDVADVYLPREMKDANDALKRGLSAAEFKTRLEAGAMIAQSRQAKAAAPVLAGPVPTETAALSPHKLMEAVDIPPTAAPAAPTVEHREDGVHVAFGPRSYRVVGLAAKRREHLRVSLKVESAGMVHVDHLDLYSAKSRAAFVACCRKVFEAQEGELHRELSQMIEELEKIQALWGEEKKPGGPPVLSEEARQEALAALQDPALLPNILRDMGAIYVGEEPNKALGYLVGISRKMDDPMSCITISQSGAGKSGLVEIVELLTPPEDVRMYSRMTQYALYYDAKTGFKHKILIAEEQGGAEEADYAIRTFLSKKRLTLLVPVKDPATGQMKNEERLVEGPVAYMGTTTKGRINDENATRCFLIFLDESEEQTRRIHERQRLSKTLEGLQAKTAEAAMIRRHHNMQRLLRPLAVVIPYAHLLDFPTTWLRTRRDNLRFLNLVQSVAFLHQYQREVKTTADSVEYIEATPADYEAAFALAQAVMGESFNDLKKPQRELLRAIESLAPADGTSAGGVTRRQIREYAGLADTRLRDLLAELVSLEYLRDATGGGQGKMCRYQLTDRLGSQERRLIGLTTPEELAVKMGALR